MLGVTIEELHNRDSFLVGYLNLLLARFFCVINMLYSVHLHLLAYFSGLWTNTSQEYLEATKYAKDHVMYEY